MMAHRRNLQMHLKTTGKRFEVVAFVAFRELPNAFIALN